jgi:phospholipid transport system substrate-binding protein
MAKSNSLWKVWDLVIDDVSTVRNYREQFTTILESKSLAGLIDILRKKADSLEHQ